jgi:hypothetical protein
MSIKASERALTPVRAGVLAGPLPPVPRTTPAYRRFMTAPMFVARTTVIHVVTYFLAGLVFSNLLDYRAAFEQPVIRDYMVEYGSTALYIGPIVQVVRGVLFGLVLLPFRRSLDSRLGWLWLWLLVIVVGVVSTPAAAPSSLEGLVYSQIPLWYHLFGLPEMLMQTLVFSVLVWALVRFPRGILAALPPVAGTIVGAVAAASFAFIGYAIVSVVIALGLGADLADPANLGLRTQGLFIAPFLLNIALVAVLGRRLKWMPFAAVAYGANAVALVLYQALVLGEPSALYILVAPLVPAAILTATRRMSRPTPAAEPSALVSPMGPAS